MLYRSENWAWGAVPAFGEGDVVEECNIVRLTANTPTAEGVSDLTFRRCNMVNCRIQPSWTIEDCNTLQMSYCVHEFPELLEHGAAAEPENCPHVVETDVITIDGQVVDTIYHRKHTVVT